MGVNDCCLLKHGHGVKETLGCWIYRDLCLFFSHPIWYLYFHSLCCMCCAVL